MRKQYGGRSLMAKNEVRRTFGWRCFRCRPT